MTACSTACLGGQYRLEHVSSRKYAFATVAVATAVALSACSGTSSGEPKPWPNVGTGAVAAAPTTATVKPLWQDVTVARNTLSSDDVDHAQFGATPAPGIKIGHRKTDGTKDMCTIGPAVAPTMSPTAGGFLTAGHCTADLAPTPQYLQPDADGPYTEFAPAIGAVNAGPVDAAAIWTTGPQPRAAVGQWPVAGVFTERAVRDLPPGTPVCVNGAKTGVVCGGLISANDGGRLRFDAPGMKGDSGGPVFVVDENNRATLIGIIKGGAEDGSNTTATYLDPTLRALKAKALVDRSVAVDPAMDPRYSDRVSGIA